VKPRTVRGRHGHPGANAEADSCRFFQHFSAHCAAERPGFASIFDHGEKKPISPHVGNVSYLGVGGGKNGSNPAMEEAKTEALKLQNELSRVKLEKLRGDLLERREVIFVVEHTLVVLRQRILGLPALVCAELRELDHNQLYAIRRKVEGVVDDALTQAADTLVQAPRKIVP